MTLTNISPHAYTRNRSTRDSPCEHQSVYGNVSRLAAMFCLHVSSLYYVRRLLYYNEHDISGIYSATYLSTRFHIGQSRAVKCFFSTAQPYCQTELKLQRNSMRDTRMQHFNSFIPCDKSQINDFVITVIGFLCRLHLLLKAYTGFVYVYVYTKTLTTNNLLLTQAALFFLKITAKNYAVTDYGM